MSQSSFMEYNETSEEYLCSSDTWNDPKKE